MNDAKVCPVCERTFTRMDVYKDDRTDLRWARRRLCSNQCRIAELASRSTRGTDPRVLPGERLIRNACSDVAGCGCRAFVHETTGIECTSVGRNVLAGVDRCLNCGARWKSRDYRWQPLERLEAA